MRPSNDLDHVWLARKAVDFRKGINGLGAHPVSGPVVMRSFGLLQVGQRSRSASSFQATNAAGFYYSRPSMGVVTLSQI